MRGRYGEIVNARVDTLFYAMHMARISNADVRSRRGYTTPNPLQVLVPSALQGTEYPWEEDSSQRTRTTARWITPVYTERAFDLRYAEGNRRRHLMESLLWYRTEDLFEDGQYVALFQTMVDEWRMAVETIRMHAVFTQEFLLVTGQTAAARLARGRPRASDHQAEGEPPQQQRRLPWDSTDDEDDV